MKIHQAPLRMTVHRTARKARTGLCPTMWVGEGEGEGDIDVINTTWNKQEYLLHIAY